MHVGHDESVAVGIELIVLAAAHGRCTFFLALRRRMDNVPFFGAYVAGMLRPFLNPTLRSRAVKYVSAISALLLFSASFDF